MQISWEVNAEEVKGRVQNTLQEFVVCQETWNTRSLAMFEHWLNTSYFNSDIKGAKG